MIRRDAISADGSPAWVLISQVDHAHLAGELAEGWLASDALAAHRDVVVPTIYRHDDGWREWESAPTIDPDNGLPRSFLEMPIAVAHDIWRQSIARVADLGPLAQYMVAEHFCRLRSAAGDREDPEVRQFLAEFGQRSQQWLAAWRAEDALRNTMNAAVRAVDWLQFFDVLSLWLCMAERTERHELALPGGGTLELMPCAGSETMSTIVARPCPWPTAQRDFSAPGRVISAEPLRDDDALQAALADAASVTLTWRFVAD